MKPCMKLFFIGQKMKKCSYGGKTQPARFSTHPPSSSSLSGAYLAIQSNLCQNWQTSLAGGGAPKLSRNRVKCSQPNVRWTLLSW